MPTPSTPDRAKAEATILRRMREGPFRFVDLVVLADKEQGVGYDHSFYRLADRLIQRERKAGRITQASRGNWLPVEAA